MTTHSSENYAGSDDALLTAQLVCLQAPGTTKTAVIELLASLIAGAGRAKDAAALAADVLAREATAATGIPGGIAIPHCRSAQVLQPTLAFARLRQPVDFGAADGGGAQLVFMIAAPAGADDFHLQLLAKLARALMRTDFISGLRQATTAAQVVELVTAQVQPELLSGSPSPAVAGSGADSASHAPNQTAAAPDTASDTVGAAGADGARASAAAPAASEQRPKLIVGVSSCPTGIAHTFMAAEALEQAGKACGVEVHIEGQGSGKIDWLDDDLIRRADAVIFAHDLPVKGQERFAGKPVVDVDVKAGVNDAPALVARALAAAADSHAPRVAGASARQDADAGAGASENLHWARRLQRAVLSGVSYMIPFVAAGGLLTALGFLLGGYDIGTHASTIVLGSDSNAAASLWHLPDLTNPAYAAPNALGGSALAAYVGAVFSLLGSAAMGLLVPALAAYTAFGLAGRPGIAPGFVVGLVALDTGSGFIGGLLGGILAGYLASWLAGLSAPRWLRSLLPVVIIPLCTTLVVGALMYMLLGTPLAAVINWLTDSLTAMAASGSAVWLGIILGLMMCFDLGGPVNKAAYLFATAGLSAATAASYQIMAAVMAAGMVPPLALALATVIRPRLFTQAERDNGRAAWLLGASFISEGAIPFAAADPLRIIPPSMLGGAVTGALTMALHVGSRAPHGGIFVFFAIDNVFGFFLALIVGAVVACAGVVTLKSWAARKRVAQ